MPEIPKWWIYRGAGQPHNGIERLPPPPSWRRFEGENPDAGVTIPEFDPGLERRFGGLQRGETFQASDNEIEMVNAALYLRRPMLITGKPGIGKSSLAYAVAHELQLGRVLVWPITSRATLREALYRYDAVGRLQEPKLRESATSSEAPDIGRYVRLGPLGTALLPSQRPRVLLIDEIDKSDIDLPNDLLHVFEEGEFEIPELARLPKAQEKVQVMTDDPDGTAGVVRGRVRTQAFPFIVITSNAERELPAPFLRRCLRLDMGWPADDKEKTEKLARIVRAHFADMDGMDQATTDKCEQLIGLFVERLQRGDLATDQLLNAVYLTARNVELLPLDASRQTLIDTVLRYLST